MAEQRARLVHPPFADQPPDAGAADDEVLVADRIDLLGLEPVADSQRSQQGEIAGAIVSEQEVRADPDLRDPEPVDEHGLDEGLRVPARHLEREAHDRGAMQAGVGEGVDLLRLRHQQRRRLVGADDAGRVRIEGHDHRRRAALAGDAADAVEDLAMPAVQPVEVAEGEDRPRPARRPRIIGKMDHIHESRHARQRRHQGRRGHDMHGFTSASIVCLGGDHVTRSPRPRSCPFAVITSRTSKTNPS